MTTIDAKSLLAIRSQILERNAVLARASAPATAQPADFGATMQQALGAVNEQHSRSSALSAAYARGDTTDIAAVLMQRSEEHTSELQSLLRISYAVFCLQKKQKNINFNIQ